MSASIDLVFLGQTVPEKRRRSGVIQVCSAGYSPTLRSLFRIYPLPVSFGGQRWAKYQIPVERNPQDSRRESLKVASAHRKGALDLVPTDMALLGKVDRLECLGELERLIVPSIEHLNAERRSLGILRPGSLDGYWCCNPQHAPLLEQSDLFQGRRRDVTKKGFDHWARLRFQDEGGSHDLMLNAWDVYEWHRRHSNDHPLTDVWERLKIGDRDYDHLLLVGNMNGRRNVWLVIAVLQHKREIKTMTPALPLFELAGV